MILLSLAEPINKANQDRRLINNDKNDKKKRMDDAKKKLQEKELELEELTSIFKNTPLIIFFKIFYVISILFIILFMISSIISFYSLFGSFSQINILSLLSDLSILYASIILVKVRDMISIYEQKFRTAIISSDEELISIFNYNDKLIYRKIEIFCFISLLIIIIKIINYIKADSFAALFIKKMEEDNQDNIPRHDALKKSIQNLCTMFIIIQLFFAFMLIYYYISLKKIRKYIDDTLSIKIDNVSPTKTN